MTDKQAGIETEGQSDRLAGRRTDRQKGRRTDRLKSRKTD
jgi:hypothetical protein